jgi:repressor of nif and glnA expression
MTSGFQGTDKQVEIMKIIIQATGNGETLILEDIQKRLSYGDGVSNIAIFYSLKYLEKHGLIVKERVGREAFIRPTSLGYKMMKPSMPGLP